MPSRGKVGPHSVAETNVVVARVLRMFYPVEAMFSYLIRMLLCNTSSWLI